MLLGVCFAATATFGSSFVLSLHINNQIHPLVMICVISTTAIPAAYAIQTEEFFMPFKELQGFIAGFITYTNRNDRVYSIHI